MSFEFTLRLARRLGRPAGVVDRHLICRGLLCVSDARDDDLHRTVRSATFEMTEPGADPVPPLHDVVLLGVRDSTMSLAGYEEVPDGALRDLRRYQQTWLLEPAANRDLARAERRVERLAHHLEGLGVLVRVDERGRLFIPDGRRPGDGAPLEWE